MIGPKLENGKPAKCGGCRVPATRGNRHLLSAGKNLEIQENQIQND
jgi:hypothetical protein